jgi:L-rhamnose isomerase
MPSADYLTKLYPIAKERYAEVGVDTEAALKRIAGVAVSLHCWQGDDVGGFESSGSDLGGGLAVTGNYPGKARNADELRGDLDRAMSLVPGHHRFNLHAIYGEFEGQKVDRDQIGVAQFQGWIDWAKSRKMGLDFNGTFFSHPKAADGFTLSHRDSAVREFWIEHGRRCRDISAAMGKQLGTACVHNVWIPDGYKDTPADRLGPRQRLMHSLDEIFGKALPREHVLDAVEPKLFGIGSESYVVGSHEFYLGYAVKNGILMCLDAGHYHPTEGIADKISAVLCYLPEILLHVSRGVRWDSDHVVTATDDLAAIGREIVANGFTKRVHLGLDFFDASINRIAAWVIGARCLLRSLLVAMLEPTERLRTAEQAGDYTTRLMLQEELKTFPWASVWDEFCRREDVPVGEAWLAEVRRYEHDVLARRK